MEKNDFNPDLLNDLVAKQVVIFIGSGLSSGTAVSLPGWEKFLLDASEKLPPIEKAISKKLICEGDFLLSCDVIKNHLKDEWQDLISAEFGKVPHSSELHEEIKKLNQRIIVTTNFDKIIEKFWNDGTYNGGSNFRPMTQIDGKSFRFLRGEDGVIIKLHGCIDKADDIIFSKTEYIRKAYSSDYYRKLVESLLLNYTILFVGFSMTDPAISQLMELYTNQFSNVRPHWIIHPTEDPVELAEFRNKHRKLKSITYEGSRDHSNLLPLLKSLTQQYEIRRRLYISDYITKNT
jgi:hypothetical protein